MNTHWTYTTACHCCGTECDHHIPTLEADPDNGLSYGSFEITVQRLQDPIWRKCRKCCAVTRNIVVYYDDNQPTEPDTPLRECSRNGPPVMEKEIQTHAKKTDIPADMWEAVGALRGALGDNPCVILDESDTEGNDRHYFFSDPELYAAIQDVVENLPGKTFQGHSYVALACALQKHGVICEAAVNDATVYDGGKTLRGILRAFEDLNSPANERGLATAPEDSESN